MCLCKFIPKNLCACMCVSVCARGGGEGGWMDGGFRCVHVYICVFASRVFIDRNIHFCLYVCAHIYISVCYEYCARRIYVYVYVYVHVYMYMYVCACTCECVFVCMCMCTCVCVCVCVCMCMCMCMCVCVWVCVCVFVCVCVLVCVYMCV
jgi:hypothetical protein